MMSPVLLRAGEALASKGTAGLLAAGLGDALASDSARPMLAQAAWAAVDAGFLTLPRAWAMISERPAEILRLADRGRLDPGLRADLTVVNAATRRVEATISAGRLVHVSGEASRRFAAAALPFRIAAE
jgi:alpha-D-ribose 1-methylphosphonate 5-triphosphate diphosphatase